MLIHPFDDPLLWQGHASLIDEIASVHRKPGAVVLSVGGGGLLAGVVEGRGNGWHDVPVIAVETEGASSLAASPGRGPTRGVARHHQHRHLARRTPGL